MVRIHASSEDIVAATERHIYLEWHAGRTEHDGCDHTKESKDNDDKVTLQVESSDRKVHVGSHLHLSIDFTNNVPCDADW